MMQKIFDNVEHVIIYVIQYIGLIVFGIFTLASMLITLYVPDMGASAFSWRWDIWPVYLIVILAALIGLRRLSVWVAGKKRGETILLLLVLGYIALMSLILLVFGNAAPNGDSYSVYDLGFGFSQNSYYTAFAWPGSYLNFYPQQLGLAVYYEWIFRLCESISFPVSVYHVIKLFNVGLVLITVFCQWLFVRRLENRGLASIYYLLIVPFCLPLIFYSSFTYGEVPSLAFISLSCLGIQKLVEKKKWYYVLMIGVAVALSVLLRKNSLIFVIAAVIILLLSFFREQKCIYLVTTVVVMGAALLAPHALKSHYETKAGASLSAGVSAWSYFAMGMQDSESGAGVYNGYNFDVYAQCQGDAELIEEVSKAALKERATYLFKHPLEMGSFYARKLLGQWMDGEFECRKYTAVNYGNRIQFFHEIYDGKLANAFTEICSVYQFFIYAGVLCSMAYVTVKKAFLQVKPYYYIGLLTVLGGVAFHLLWEAASRYGFVYLILMLPYAAWGLSRVKKADAKYPKIT